MIGETSKRTFWLGLLVSVVAHLGVAWAFFAVNERNAEAGFHRPNAEALEREQRIDLGDPESTAISMSWLGFEEYQKHSAAPAEVDQPQLTMDPASAPPGSVSPAVAATAVQRAARAAAAEASRAMDRLARGLRALEGWAEVIPEGTERSRVAAGGDGERETPAERETPVAEAEPTKQAKEQPRPVEQASQGAVAGAQGRRAVEGEDGRRDDRESDATSVARSLADLGKPLSARGLRIRTRKPTFSHITSIMSNPRDPIVRIHFNATGQAQRVDLIQSSGNPDIDRPVLDAVYRWTAQGESLEQLGASETISIDVRILL